VVSDDGWSVLRTHGFRPEVVAVSPAGNDAVRVRISEHRSAVSAAPVFSWSPRHLIFSTAGLYWAGDSWRYFLNHSGSPYFAWRTSWGERLVMDLGRAVLSEDPELAPALDEEEKRGVTALLAELTPRMEEVRVLLFRTGDEEVGSEPLAERVRQVRAALHLVGVHRLKDCAPFLREWEVMDCPGSSQGSEAMPDGWWREAQYFRPVVQHSLRLLGEEPVGFPAYNFTNFGDNTRRRFPIPERVPDRGTLAAHLRRGMSAEEVLGRLGSPDHIQQRWHEARFWTEDWEYDYRVAGRWVTMRLTWKEGRLLSAEEVPPYWLESSERETEFFGL
jgi:hypothetical protein